MSTAAGDAPRTEPVASTASIAAGPADRPGPIVAFCQRHYAALVVGLLCLAVFNLTFRLGREIVTEWDESLYAITASEIVESGNWILTTFDGAVDYYNTKPPLNVWLIALSFKIFGTSFISLRLPSVLFALASIAALVYWAGRRLGPPIGLLGGLVLSTTFGFFQIHSARSGNGDALFTLLVQLIAFTCLAALEKPWWRVWLGPLLAGMFLLKGFGFIGGLTVMAVVALLSGLRFLRDWRPTLAAAGLFALVVLPWAVARYLADGWKFFELMVGYDMLARTFTVIEGHPGGPFYYLNLLAKHHYDWLLAALAAWVLCPIPWAVLRPLVTFWRANDLVKVLVAWAVATMVVPAVMSTKLPWYLNPFYPEFALLVAVLIGEALRRWPPGPTFGRRRMILAGTVVLVVITAEARLFYYSYAFRNLSGSVQGLLLKERDALRGQRIYRRVWERRQKFVIRSLIGAEDVVVPSAEVFLEESEPGHFLVSTRSLKHRQLVLVRTEGQFHLYRRVEGPVE